MRFDARRNTWLSCMTACALAGAALGKEPADLGRYDARVKPDDRAHWSYQPVRDAAVPAVKNAAWVSNPIDAFVLARLEHFARLAVGPEATRLPAAARLAGYATLSAYRDCIAQGLERDADQPALDYYTKYWWTDDAIRTDVRNSVEYGCPHDAGSHAAHLRVDDGDRATRQADAYRRDRRPAAWQ